MKIYNTLSARLEEFTPAADPVTVYVCGVTPYDDSHVGHALSYIVFDVLRRYLEYKGLHVRHVQNFTDIDDKLIARAAVANTTVAELAGRFIERYLDDMRDLNVLPATVYPRATEEIDKIVEIIGTLIERGFAYAADGDVYYRVRNKADYGKLSHRTIDSMIAEARVEAGEGKEFAGDFALWKGAKPGEPAWESPWGPGRPGWHIECSAMALRYLGSTIDIHGGGNDLIFPHHENEIAQSEGAHQCNFVNYWMHNGFVNVDKEKMSKSLGNFFTIREVLKKYDPEEVRFFILRAHYRSPLNYSDVHLDDARQSLDRLYRALENVPMEQVATIDWSESHAERFKVAMDDDFNTPEAMAVLFDMANELNRNKSALTARQLKALGGVLGLLQEDPIKRSQRPRNIVGTLNVTLDDMTVSATGTVTHTPESINHLIEARIAAKQAKNYAEADRIRKELLAAGIVLEDTPQGTTWRRA
jgi:cysteinyl-tRNA synthetase